MTVQDGEWLTLEEAAPVVGYTAVYLRVAIQRGQLRARKRGRRWEVRLGDVRAFAVREPDTIRGRGQKRRWQEERDMQAMAERTDESERRPSHGDGGTALATLHTLQAAYRTIARERAVSNHEAKASVLAPARSRTVAAVSFLRRLDLYARELASAADQDLELFILDNRSLFQVALTHARFDAAVAAVTFNNRDTTFEQDIRSAAIYLDVTRTDGWEPIALVLVTAETHLALYRRIIDSLT